MKGINIQSPWAYLLIQGKKCVETRSYPLPKKLEGQTLAVIETPGKSKKFKSRIIGTITFSHSFQYPNETAWRADYNRHLVDSHDIYGWNNKPKYGWVVSDINKFDEPIDPPKKRGIVYVSNCAI